ncbi:MAG: hypothetical protein D6730_25455 [Bacteroidetes bacterium]|nr:MAG: hypothetical protein D6730_25455 [Bacteroidota bacterium]
MENQQHQVLTPKADVVSMGDWMVTLLLMAIPVVGIIMLFVYAFGGNTNPNKASWAKATLIYLAIGVGIYAIS